MSVQISPLEFFRSKGIPHRRIEEWKYSDLRAVLDAETVAQAGRLPWNLGSAPKGVEVTPLTGGSTPLWALGRLKSRALSEPMDAASWAFAVNGVALRIPAGMQVAEPLSLKFELNGHAQIVLLLEKGASATLLEEHLSGGKGLRNVSFVAFLDEGAEFTHVRQASYDGERVSIETIDVHVGKDGRYRANIAGSGAKLSRTKIAVTLAGEGAEGLLSGVSVLAGGAHADVSTHIDHAVGKTTSRQLFKMVAGGHSRAIYQGKITVREGANGSDSRQTAKALLLGAHAEADLKPELEILADDVKCAHGAAVGDLDPDSLFYLRSRGIPETEARSMLIRGFLEEPIAEIAREEVRSAVWTFVESGLAQALEAQP